MPDFLKKRDFIRSLVAIICGSSLLIGSSHFVYGASDDEVKQKIQEKSQQLNELNKQILENQKKLEETQTQKRSVSNELKSIDTKIKQIDLGIQSSQVLIEKLDYQLDELGSNIQSTEEEIAQKQQAVNEILRSVQQSDAENVLLSVLGNKTLSESILKIQSLTDLNDSLTQRIQDLSTSKNKLNEIKNNTTLTKDQKEAEFQNYKNKKVIASELKDEKNRALELTKKKESEYQKSLKELEEKQAQIAAEIEQMEAQLRKKINYDDIPKSSPGILAMPVSGIVTQDHGSTQFAKNAYRGKWHNGLDFGAPIGTPIVASESGTVLSVDNQDLYCRKGAYGKYVALAHDNGLVTLYGHMSRYVVTKGQTVKRGEVIGYVGSTGYATGPHLHFGVYDAKTFRIGASNSCGPNMPYGGDLNPRDYLQF